jgi:tol-pal system protein YbgF
LPATQNNGPAPLAEGGSPAGSDMLASAAPPAPPAPGILGQIPADTPLPTVRTGQPPAAPADPKREFDSAMSLLSRAQYQQASLAFRSFADAHPDDDRASAALYWTGDIAFSTKKDYDEAARDFAEVLKKYPKSARAPDSMLKLGLSLFELGQMKEGCAALAALPAKYPTRARDRDARAQRAPRQQAPLTSNR